MRSDSGRALGFELNVEQLRTLPTVERSGRIRKRLRCFLVTQTCRWMGTGRPDGPCDFSGPPQTGDPVALPPSAHSLASFYHRREPLWIGARAKLEAFVGIMILTEADWARPWLPGVLASDASLTCYGVAQSFWNPSDIVVVGRIPEVRRWRCGAVLARRHAF